MHSVRIGTWNLGRSGAFHRTRIPRQIHALQQRNADLWVLTEAHDANIPPGGHVSSSAPHGDFHQKGEHRVVLWSRFALRPVATEDALSTVAARLEVPWLDRPLLVYGTVISPAQGGVVQRPALSWQRHLDMVQRQRAEWLRLRQEFPDHALCVAGDFNANLDATASYGSVDPRHSLLQGLADAGLQCLTTDDKRDPLEQGVGRAGVAHVCFSALEGLESRLEAWPASAEGYRLSDQSGILVELSWPQPQVQSWLDSTGSS
ncbi:hypothetical protein SM757_13205 [Azohydromonas lata]|uniref:Endonuclease/exonuclease/phosphatase domain-containing protein n=1 Tax=Azohydromonas lata TaxID=45677 RepID=A0ABU5IEJ0_9BURK|nr:endonuclease/exonuclease/phosphatase family protein [Azohydromonas lata]MDZ5457532.1 hypothetical protein [Azohydromonas lata]